MFSIGFQLPPTCKNFILSLGEVRLLGTAYQTCSSPQYLLEKSCLLGTAYQTRSSPQYLLEKSRLLGTAYQTRSLPAISLGEVAFTWYCVPNTLSPRNISWRSRLVWSRARDWKSRNRQKRFKSSNLFFSANT